MRRTQAEAPYADDWVEECCEVAVGGLWLILALVTAVGYVWLSLAMVDLFRGVGR